MYGIVEIKAINDWAASKACKKAARKPVKLKRGPKTVRMQGREVTV